jgi:hypothetical protein
MYFSVAKSEARKEERLLESCSAELSAKHNQDTKIAKIR